MNGAASAYSAAMRADAGGPTRIEIAAVYGAATPPGKLALALETALEAVAADSSVVVSRVDLNAEPLAIAGAVPPGEDAVAQKAVETVGRADGAVIASPVYRGSFPGVLKNLLDVLPVEALRGKPVALVVVGATSHHYLGVDRHLRDVLAWFGALPLPVSVYLTSDDFGESGIAPAAAEELRELADALIGLARVTRDGPAGPPPLAARHG